MIDALM
jgi:hypothetical protein